MKPALDQNASQVCDVRRRDGHTIGPNQAWRHSRGIIAHATVMVLVELESAHESRLTCQGSAQDTSCVIDVCAVDDSAQMQIMCSSL